MMRRLIVAGTALLLTGAAGMAQSAANQPLREIAYLSGGIGEAEQQRLRARESEFNLKLVFTLNEGNYLAGVNVAIADDKGRSVLQDVADGPFFLVSLPAGHYTIAATHDGKTVRSKIQVGTRGLRTEHLRWPSNPANDLAISRWARE